MPAAACGPMPNLAALGRGTTRPGGLRGLVMSPSSAGAIPSLSLASRTAPARAALAVCAARARSSESDCGIGGSPNVGIGGRPRGSEGGAAGGTTPGATARPAAAGGATVGGRCDAGAG
eukprot:4046426-Prymnesium_polylepis.1